MIDFKKLLDPEHQAKVRAEREEQERQAEATEKKHREMLETCDQNHEALSAKERDFVRHCRYLLNSFRLLSGKQASWLTDIAARFAPQGKPQS